MVANIASTAASITAMPIQPMTVCRADSVKRPMMVLLCASSIITIMIGTAITPLICADQISALMGSIGVKLSAMPPMVASEYIWAEPAPLTRRSRPGSIADYMDVLLDLYATDAEYSADALEGIYQNLEEVSGRVLQKEFTDQDAAAALNAIANEEDLNGRIRRNMMDTRRAVSFLMRGRLLSSEQFEEARQILRDIESLDGHTSFLSDKINFLMDATVGFININQNKIIKIFSVASVALITQTLIASIYGMNFKHWFPELEWSLGYPFTLP